MRTKPIAAELAIEKDGNIAMHCFIEVEVAARNQHSLLARAFSSAAFRGGYRHALPFLLDNIPPAEITRIVKLCVPKVVHASFTIG